MMFAEINRTMKENRSLTGSRMMGNVMWREKREIKFHWIRVVLFKKIKYSIIGIRISNKDLQMMNMCSLGVDFRSIKIKGRKTILKPQLSVLY